MWIHLSLVPLASLAFLSFEVSNFLHPVSPCLVFWYLIGSNLDIDRSYVSIRKRLTSWPLATISCIFKIIRKIAPHSSRNTLIACRDSEGNLPLFTPFLHSVQLNWVDWWLASSDPHTHTHTHLYTNPVHCESNRDVLQLNVIHKISWRVTQLSFLKVLWLDCQHLGSYDCHRDICGALRTLRSKIRPWSCSFLSSPEILLVAQVLKIMSKQQEKKNLLKNSRWSTVDQAFWPPIIYQ